MIRVYSANFSKKDYENLSRIFARGLRTVVPISHCQKQLTCHDCEYFHVCVDVLNAIDYCDEKATEMVEP